MIYRAPFPDDDSLTHGVMSRRVAAWFIDVILIGVIVVSLWVTLMLFGFLTLGLGFGTLGILPFVPFCYHFISLVSPLCATPGQHWLGLVVLQNDSFARPTALQAVISTLVFYLTLATSGLLLLIALITVRHRTLHDLISGLVVVRINAVQPLTPPYGYGNIPGGSPYA
ncbi:MAG TPA: RDD family protein [Acetobacteraceae bacterium]|nr:RDD family protein [Acetobacteraceae bacterium]